MQISTMNRNMAMLQMEQTEASQSARDGRMDARRKQHQAKIESLYQNQDAAALRGEAENIKAGCNAAASGIGVAAAACACFPPVGTVIGAILAVVAAVVVLIGQIMAKAKEDEAAALEQQAGVKDMVSERHGDEAEEVRQEDQDRRQYVEQFREKLQELQREGRQVKGG